jgi:hypothetical protein
MGLFVKVEELPDIFLVESPVKRQWDDNITFLMVDKICSTKGNLIDVRSQLP